MSNHLHELRELIEGNAPIFFDHMAEKQMDHVAENFDVASSQAVCFEAGDIDDVLGFKIIEELVRLPYPVMWIEGRMDSDVGGHSILGQLVWTHEGVINSAVFRKLQGQWRYLFGFEHRDGKQNVGHFDKGWPRDFLRLPVQFLFKFLSALNCTNINRVEHKPPEKLQKARARRGKKPLFSYWTLEIDLPKSRAAGENYGGTHAAPRLHLRRGHPRQYAPGKYCWVQPCVVGNKAAGMVHKDYAARYQ